MSTTRILNLLLLASLFALGGLLTGCPDDDDDDTGGDSDSDGDSDGDSDSDSDGDSDSDSDGDSDSDSDGDTDTIGECDFETYCGHYIDCGWYADQDACTKTTQPWIDECVGSIPDWIDCSCECFEEFECAETEDLDDCVKGCYANNCQ